MTSFEEYVAGTTSNAHGALSRYRPFITVLRTLNSTYELLLSQLTGIGEGTIIFAAMSHAAFLAAVKLATSGELPPSYMVFRGTLEDALYGFYLFHHPELKAIWIARHESEAAKKRVRDEFPIARMRKFLVGQNEAIGSQFGLVYETTIDLGAHPNALALTSHLMPVPDSTDHIWQYINLRPEDQAMCLRVGAMAALNALNIFALLFREQFVASGAGNLKVAAHNQFAALPDAATGEESAAESPS